MNPRERKPRGPDWLPTWEMIALGLGDTAMLIIFAIIGRSSHQSAPVEGPVIDTINTAMPFVVAWLVVGAIAGAFTGKALYPVTRVLWKTALAAIIAAPLGVALRSALAGGPELRLFAMEWSFVGVATGFTTALLVAWRVIWSRVRRLWWPELP